MRFVTEGDLRSSLARPWLQGFGRRLHKEWPLSVPREPLRRPRNTWRRRVRQQRCWSTLLNASCQITATETRVTEAIHAQVAFFDILGSRVVLSAKGRHAYSHGGLSYQCIVTLCWASFEITGFTPSEQSVTFPVVIKREQNDSRQLDTTGMSVATSCSCKNWLDVSLF